MNQTILVGNLTKDPETRMTSVDKMVTSFTLAVSRAYSKDKESDFIQCKAFGKTAELIAQYLTKGSKAGVVGRIQTGKYDNNDGRTIYTTDVIVNEIEFLGSKPKPSDFSDLTPVDDADVPF